MIMIALIIIGIVGYTTEKSTTPVRILFKTGGGNVIFSHKAHILDYGFLKCQECHHNTLPDTSIKDWRCRDCHSQGTMYEGLCEDRAPHVNCVGVQCISCHEEMLGMGGEDCSMCHQQ